MNINQKSSSAHLHFFGLFIICILLIAGTCRTILPTDTTFRYSESDSRSLTTVINQLKNQSILLEVTPEHLEQTTDAILTQSRWQSTAHRSSFNRRITSLCHLLWHLAFLLRFCNFPANIITGFYHPWIFLAAIIYYIHRQDGQKPVNSFL